MTSLDFTGTGEPPNHLKVHTIGDGRMVLRCRPCGSFWARTLEKEGYFAWAALTERMAANADWGHAVPPLSLGCESRGLPWRVRWPGRW